MENALRTDDISALESEVDLAISEHNGDVRETVRALLTANALLEFERD